MAVTILDKFTDISGRLRVLVTDDVDTLFLKFKAPFPTNAEIRTTIAPIFLQNKKDRRAMDAADFLDFSELGAILRDFDPKNYTGPETTQILKRTIRFLTRYGLL